VPGEVKGILRPARRWREVDLVNIAFGQGVSVTPLQVAQAANVIAADGVLRPPTLVRGLLRDGRIAPLRERAPTRVVSAATARQVARMMTGVTAEGGTAPKAAVPGFEVAGKTGTAQKYDPNLGAYSRSKYVASFVGFIPAERPEVTVLVLVDEPRAGTIYGGQVAGPAFREIAVAALAAKDLYPSDPELRVEFEQDAPRTADSTVRADPDAAVRGDPEDAVERAVAALPGRALVRDAELSDLDGALSPEARALLGGPLPEPPSARSASARPAGSVMPDLRGLGLKAALEACGELELAPEVDGSGRVVAQRPAPGARLKTGARCRLELRRDG
jgi:cell division protein FtsI (penicillin-binding protein 3)